MWFLKGGEKVVDRHQSHLHEGVERLLPEALGRVESAGRNFLVEEVAMGRLVDETSCVETLSSDEVLYAQRPCRAGLTRFVKNREAEPCDSVVVILKKSAPTEYVLVTAFVGRRPEPEPWDKNATEKSVAFWQTHALVWGSEPVIPGTETTICPW
jgi:hypothetical protein